MPGPRVQGRRQLAPQLRAAHVRPLHLGLPVCRGGFHIRPWGVEDAAPTTMQKNGTPLLTGNAALTYFLLYQQFASLSNAVCTGCQFSRASVAQASRVNQSTTTASGLPRIKS